MGRFFKAPLCSFLHNPDNRRSFVVLFGVIVLIAAGPLITLAATGWFKDNSLAQPTNVNGTVDAIGGNGVRTGTYALAVAR
jgi:hypothetical protein